MVLAGHAAGIGSNHGGVQQNRCVRERLVRQILLDGFRLQTTFLLEALATGVRSEPRLGSGTRPKIDVPFQDAGGLGALGRMPFEEF